MTLASNRYVPHFILFLVISNVDLSSENLNVGTDNNDVETFSELAKKKWG